MPELNKEASTVSLNGVSRSLVPVYRRGMHEGAQGDTAVWYALDATGDDTHATLGLRFPVGYESVAGQESTLRGAVAQTGVMPWDHDTIGDSDIADLDRTEEILELLGHSLTSYQLNCHDKANGFHLLWLPSRAILYGHWHINAITCMICPNSKQQSRFSDNKDAKRTQHDGVCNEK
jgi:hypothetical protein